MCYICKCLGLLLFFFLEQSSKHNNIIIVSYYLSLFHFLSAAEYSSLLFFYSLPCMKGILSYKLFNHYALLVGGIYLLCQETISPADLRKAEMLLAHSVEMFNVYYGMVCYVLSIYTCSQFCSSSKKTITLF